MSEPTPTPSTPTFVSTTVYGYVLPTPAQMRMIERKIRKMGEASGLSQVLVRQLLTIKLLAPDASRDMQIYQLPEVSTFLASLSSALVQRYQGEVR